MKLVGYTEVIHSLHSGSRRTHRSSSRRPCEGTPLPRFDHCHASVNGAVTSMVGTLAIELAPVRVNAVHPGIVGDSPYWAGKSESACTDYCAHANRPLGHHAGGDQPFLPSTTRR
jgi:NAD(P)-dependent dehydrogenase (short-subunit alcohol dehydrogenase family)